MNISNVSEYIRNSRLNKKEIDYIKKNNLYQKIYYEDTPDRNSSILLSNIMLFGKEADNFFKLYTKHKNFLTNVYSHKYFWKLLDDDIFYKYIKGHVVECIFSAEPINTLTENEMNRVKTVYNEYFYEVIDYVNEVKFPNRMLVYLQDLAKNLPEYKQDQLNAAIIMNSFIERK